MPTIDATGRIADIIEPTLAELGYRLVQVQLLGGRRQCLQVMVERLDGNEMTVEDCCDVSPELSAVLDVHDPIAGSYTLEVSSPGIDRPLTRPDDFATWAGFDAKLELARKIEGRKRFKGQLLGLSDDGQQVSIAVTDKGRETQTWTVPVEAIQRAKLILTDALLDATAGSHH